MISIQYRGRLGNNMIQYFAGRVLSDKFNFYLNTKPRNIGNNWGKFFNISPPKGNIKGSKFIEINDSNFIEYLSEDVLPPKHYVLNGFFQTSSFLHKYADTIKNYLHIKYVPQNLNKVFVAYRIGDTNGLRQMLPKEYYEEALNNLHYDGGYITSDTLDHSYIKELSNKYNLERITFQNPLEAIDFAKNFNNLILSEGTFSWWIGFLSKAKNIYCNDRDYKWFGRTIFDFNDWKHLCWDYDNNSMPINLKD